MCIVGCNRLRKAVEGLRGAAYTLRDGGSLQSQLLRNVYCANSCKNSFQVLKLQELAANRRARGFLLAVYKQRLHVV